MKKIVIYSDASIKIKKQANATIIFDKSNENEKTLIYRTGGGNNSQEAELYSVLYGLEYVKEFIQIEDEELFIEVRTDELFIVTFINNKLHIEWDKISWRKGTSTKPLRKDALLWYSLTLLIKHFGIDNISATKVTTKEDKTHRLADRVANNMLPIASLKFRQFYKVSPNPFTNIKDLINLSEMIEIPELELDLSDLPWRKAKKKHSKKKEKKTNIISWIGKVTDSIVNIPTKDIMLEEEIHLNCHKLNFNGKLKEYSKQEKIENPIAVRKISDNKYALVMGIQRYFAAKILDIEVIPAIITDLNYADFSTKMDELINN
ncbi:ParB N-terminal domain-containing protein [Clostridium sp. 'White wine YQ']|uniref:ParB N-terminal domain-containing protein n=1 Tax=Clostridium sp. 'White wine YQ' TaxID=3027474 RepID=UPI002365BEF5|nr:ParB N-terminal domain-containing protein [Clostridium sp. 'White wine YQ']MDD7796310.1 ParB N-terminal domain-containing protein [Clostridium sp. 'White wine YQ']